MAILDTSIVNVVLPRMMSSFGVNRDKIEWVSTGYMLTSSVTMPLVAWLMGRLGSKALYLGAMALFLIGSALCAFSWSYNTIIGARIVQAIGAGAMMPAGMTIVATLFERHERGKALGIWGTGIMVGPTIGPTLGGYLTDYFSWRTVFSVNLPFGILALFAGLALMKNEKAEQRMRSPFDPWGYLFLAMALISGLLALSEGQSEGWNSSYIQTCLALSIIGLIMFIAVESSVRHPLLNLSLFKYRNFSLCMILAIFRGVGLFGGIFLLPMFLMNLSGFTTIKAGLWMMPGGIVMGVMMPLSGFMADRYSPRWLVSIGTVITSFSLFMYGSLDPLHGATMIIGPQMIRAAGFAFMMAPLMTAAINAVPLAKVAMASSFLNVVQQVSGSFGIALVNNNVTNAIREHSMRIGELIDMRSDAFHHFLEQVSRAVSWYAQGMPVTDSGREELLSAFIRHAPGFLSDESAQGLMLSSLAIFRRATVLGFENGFVFCGMIVLAGLPLCMMLKGSRESHHVT
jgi:EmrB/QacA subfamily drug resistance transporter